MTGERKLTFREKVDYVPALASIGGSAIAASFSGLVRGSEGADTYRHHVANSLIRKFNSRLNSIQSQKLQPPFAKVYQKWCKAHNQSPDMVDLDSGLSGFWMGDKERAQYVVIYFHGGGFAIGGSEGHINYWSQVRDHLKRSSIDIAFFFVTYTLSTDAVYPKQLQEAVAAVQYLIEERGRSPSELILAGDSAGGNLALATLLHMSEPCSDIGNNFTIKGSFKALILMAPWVSFKTDWPSFEKYKSKDYIEAAIEGRWSAEYLGTKPKPDTTGKPADGECDTHADSIYAEPALATSNAWFGAKCDKILVVHGSVEALTDGISDWVENYKKGIGESRVQDGAIDYYIGENEVHIAPLIWPMFGDKKETPTGAEIKRWMVANLSKHGEV